MHEMDARDGCTRWMHEMNARDGCVRWMSYSLRAGPVIYLHADPEWWLWVDGPGMVDIFLRGNHYQMGMTTKRRGEEGEVWREVVEVHRCVQCTRNKAEH